VANHLRPERRSAPGRGPHGHRYVLR
jgi:hypothetical protein